MERLASGLGRRGIASGRVALGLSAVGGDLVGLVVLRGLVGDGEGEVSGVSKSSGRWVVDTSGHGSMVEARLAAE